jgi:hypothetical protein
MFRIPFNYEKISNYQTLHFEAIMNRPEPVHKKLLVQFHSSTVYLKMFGKIILFGFRFMFIFEVLVLKWLKCLRPFFVTVIYKWWGQSL